MENNEMKDVVGIIKKGTKAIKKEAFLNNKGITSIVIPDSVTEIGESAFAGCSNLTLGDFSLPFLFFCIAS